MPCCKLSKFSNHVQICFVFADLAQIQIRGLLHPRAAPGWDVGMSRDLLRRALRSAHGHPARRQDDVPGPRNQEKGRPRRLYNVPYGRRLGVRGL